MASSLTEEEQIAHEERELAIRKRRLKSKKLCEALLEKSHNATGVLEEIVSLESEITGLLGDDEVTEEVITRATRGCDRSHGDTRSPQCGSPSLRAARGSGRSDTEASATTGEQQDDEDGAYMPPGHAQAPGDDEASGTPYGMNTRNNSRESGISPQAQEQAKPILVQLREKMNNICPDDKDNLLAIACHLCGANMPVSTGAKCRFDLQGLQIHYRKAHRCKMTAGAVWDACDKVLLTEQDIQDILAGKEPAELRGARGGKKKSRAQEGPAAGEVNTSDLSAAPLANDDSVVTDSSTTGVNAGIAQVNPANLFNAAAPFQQFQANNNASTRHLLKRKQRSECRDDEYAPPGAQRRSRVSGGSDTFRTGLLD